MKASLVLSSGGARGMAHIGVIEELIRNDIEICSIAGASIGAIVGGVYATENLHDYKEWMCNLDKLDVFKLLDFTFSNEGFIKGDRVFKEMRSFIPEINIENLNLPFAAVATDLSSRKEVVFKKGDLMNAIRCSAAIPTIFQPRKMGDKILVDGGVVNPIPVSIIERKENDVLIVVNLNSTKPYKPKKSVTDVRKSKEIAYKKYVESFKQKWNRIFPKKESQKSKIGFLDLMNTSFDLVQDQLCNCLIQKHNPDIVINISRAACGTFEFYRAAEIIEEGKNSCNEALAKANLKPKAYKQAHS